MTRREVCERPPHPRGMPLAAVGTVRAARVLGVIGVFAAAAACGAAARPQVANPGTTMCAGAEPIAVIDRASPALEVDEVAGEKVVEVELIGASTLADRLRPGIVLAPGDVLTRRAIRDEIRRLWQLGLIDDAAVRVVRVAGGVKVELVVHERGLIAGVDIERHGRIADLRLRRVRSLAGVIDDPARAQRTARRLEDELRTDGHWKAQVIARRRRTADGELRLCVGIAPGPRYQLAAVTFPGATALKPKQLAQLIAQANGAINAVGGAYRADQLDVDLQRIQAAYYEIGHVMIQVGEPVTVVDDKQARIRLSIPVTEGKRFKIGKVELKGVDPALVPGYRALLGIQPGTVFVRTALAEGMARLREAERKAGRSGEVTPLTTVEVDTATIGLTLEVAP